LEPLSLSDLDEHLKLNKVKLDKGREDKLLNWLYDITQGHPMAVEVAIHHYSQAGAKGMNHKESRGLVKAIAERVIKGYVLRDNGLQFSRALKLSLLRINDVSLLRVLVGNPSDSLLSYGKLSNELRANPLGDFGDRLLKKSVATWLHRYFRLFDPKNYLEKQEALLEECKRLCSLAHKDNWSTYVVEGIYHAACANTVTDKYDLSDILEGHLESLQSSEMARYSESLVMELRESLVRDKEIEEYIGKDGVDRLIAVLE
jgi:hypothetical protein